MPKKMNAKKSSPKVFFKIQKMNLIEDSFLMTKITIDFLKINILIHKVSKLFASNKLKIFRAEFRLLGFNHINLIKSQSQKSCSLKSGKFNLRIYSKNMAISKFRSD